MKLIKQISIIISLMISSNIYAGIIPMPIMIPYHSNGGGNIKDLIAGYILINLICIFIISLRSLLWIIEKENKSSYVDYALLGGYRYDIPVVNIIILSLTNGIAFFIIAAKYISTLI